MKKKLLPIIALAIGLLSISLGVRKQVQEEFHDQSRSASGALFLDGDAGQRRFICSGTVVGSVPGGDAYFLTARHCVYEPASDGGPFDEPTPAHLIGPEEVSFSDNEQGPFYVAIPAAISKTDDIAILRLVNGGGLPSVRLGNEYYLKTGETLTNYTYALSFGKMDLTLKAVAPAFPHTPSQLVNDYPIWECAMPIDGTSAPGSSGSGLFSIKQHALVGIVVGTTRYGGLGIAIPVSRVWNLLGNPSSVFTWEELAPKKKAEIPQEVFNSQFGKDHTFMLTVHGPYPVFTQNGYTFKADTSGLELYDDYYYKVPVYIDRNATGHYILVSTKEPVSVPVIIVSKN